MSDSAPVVPPPANPPPAGDIGPPSAESPAAADANGSVPEFSGWPPDEADAAVSTVGGGPPVEVTPAATTSLPVALTPQMLLPYFQPVPLGTNGGAGTVVIPLEFNPPLPVAPPASRATYNVR